METQNYENFRQIMRSEHLIPPNENTSELDIFYTFSSLDLKELETYLKELPSRKSDISTQMFASTM